MFAKKKQLWRNFKMKTGFRHVYMIIFQQPISKHFYLQEKEKWIESREKMMTLFLRR